MLKSPSRIRESIEIKFHILSKQFRSSSKILGFGKQRVTKM